ncbi:MAG TPA: DUF3850 domain-containing protein [Bradyrhizobium sp.]|jgi:hypothetical protein|nr:DUF3850 domain-containing protein [Bradyrhizobium sp.]
MRHLGVKCWSDSYDAIVSGRKRSDLRTLDRVYRAGDVVELVRWDPEASAKSIGTCEVLITHVDRCAGPLLLFGMQHRILLPLVCLSFVFVRADYPYPPLDRSEYCRIGGALSESSHVVDRP